MLSSNGSYQLKATVNDGSLEDCSLIRAGDKIRPYFVSSVSGDPDLTGLLVFLENSRGEAAGGKVRYTLQADSASPAATTPSQTEAGTETKTGEPVKTGDPLEKEPNAKVTTGQSASPAEPAKKPEPETVVAVKRLDKELPYFIVPKNLEIGQYTLVFQVLGGAETLSRMETALYYLGDMAFALNDIQMYLPDDSSGSRLIPPGTTVMLEARLDFDRRLNPYIVWYNGKNIIGEGKLADGAGVILWKAPEQTGFHALRVEVFPVQLRKGYAGTSREIALPVSAKVTDAGYFFGDVQAYAAISAQAAAIAVEPAASSSVPAAIPAALRPAEPKPAESQASDAPARRFAVQTPPDILHWYQFGGHLLDSKAPSTERALIPVSEKPPRWMPVDASYGLAAGPDDAYLLPQAAFFRNGEESGGGAVFVPL
jgi:hypothetical protein